MILPTSTLKPGSGSGNVCTTIRTTPLTVPIVRNLRSQGYGSSSVTDRGSSNARIAVSKLIPCFWMFALFLSSAHVQFKLLAPCGYEFGPLVQFIQRIADVQFPGHDVGDHAGAVFLY